MNRLFAWVLVGLALSAGAVFADAPTVALDPIGPLEYATFPQVYNVTGSVTHSPNVSSVSEVKLFINNVQEGLTWNPNFQNDPSAAFSLPWNILGPGVYDVKVTAKHGNSIGEAVEEDVVVTQTQVVITECPAAPSIAAHYLKELGVKAGSKLYKNLVSQVAKHMGPQTEFDGVQACHPDYALTVVSYVDNLI